MQQIQQGQLAQTRGPECREMAQKADVAQTLVQEEMETETAQQMLPRPLRPQLGAMELGQQAEAMQVAQQTQVRLAGAEWAVLCWKQGGTELHESESKALSVWGIEGMGMCAGVGPLEWEKSLRSSEFAWAPGGAR